MLSTPVVVNALGILEYRFMYAMCGSDDDVGGAHSFPTLPDNRPFVKEGCVELCMR